MPKVGIPGLKCATLRSQEFLSQLSSSTFRTRDRQFGASLPTTSRWERNWAHSRAARLPKQTRGHLVHKRLSKHLRPKSMDPSPSVPGFPGPYFLGPYDTILCHITGQNSAELLEDGWREKLQEKNNTYLRLFKQLLQGKRPWFPAECPKHESTKLHFKDRGRIDPPGNGSTVNGSYV